MNLAKRNTFFLFLVSLLLTTLMPVFFPSMTLHYLIPFIVILFYTKDVIACLWGALGCGVILDLLSPHAQLGLHAFSFTLTAAALYWQRRHFFADNATTLPLMTFFFSVLSTALHALLIGMFEERIRITKSWVVIDLLFLPFCDALFAFLVFILPFLLLGKRIRKGEEYFMSERNPIS